jgi:IS5 family transposase
VPVPRETKKWKRLYRLRGAVERVNSRLKEHLLLDELRVRGINKVRCRLGMSVLVMLAVAVGMAERKELTQARQLLRAA